ncbi:hypothetical protein CE206_29425 (plasmid) [Achromobacter xylosoxidans]|uniref:restriction endonuclease n=1 Tax=Alcaligenes xylosoxydans xylosoxydans TaxID=85698 RepID=UPI000DD0F5AD|nr:restriction endonuclease [Achromobacter xylosoxidans]AXA80690.1 hypothetical protein CE206_29425 [Achromobacter xylosoxidans]
MSELVHYEYPPPKSWEQFEELCADLFGTMWGDPGAVRNGRAGQTQNGVDIVAARGTVYPVGLQCKRKGRFPDKKLTRAEVVAEIAKADEFKPALKEFYILTTAAVDARLQEPVRLINAARRATGKFEVTILFWPDIVARVALLRDVAVKHFPLRGGDGGFSPLLATWYTKKGKLELTGVDWRLAVGELSEDFHV